MKRTLICLAGVLIPLLVTTAAYAKGPSGATIEGDGLTAPISVSGSEEDGDLGALVYATGFFAAAFRQTPDPMLDEAPSADVGPKLAVTWIVPSGKSTKDTVQQEIYPLAAGGPLTYTAPGQPFLGSEHTRGGWYRASTTLTDLLYKLGVPGMPVSSAAIAAPSVTSPAVTTAPVTSPPVTAATPAPNDGSSISWTTPAIGLIIAAAIAVLARLSLRRRTRITATT